MLVFLDITSSFFTHDPSYWLKCVWMCLFGTCGVHIQSLMSVQSVLPVCRTSWPDVGDHQGARLVPVLMDATCERSKKRVQADHTTRNLHCFCFDSAQKWSKLLLPTGNPSQRGTDLFFVFWSKHPRCICCISFQLGYFFSWKLNQQFLLLAVMGFPIFQPAPVIFTRQPWKRNKKINRWLPGEKGIN